MSTETKLSVVELDPDAKPHIGSLKNRIEDVIYDYCEKEDTLTFAEVIGILEIVKVEFINNK